MKELTLRAGNKDIKVCINLDDVYNNSCYSFIDYNLEYNVIEDNKDTIEDSKDIIEDNKTTIEDSKFNPHHVCANVCGSVNDNIFIGQVQYDTYNNCYSTTVDGNVLYDEVKRALLSSFDKDELFATGVNVLNNSTYIIESDLYCELMNEVMPIIDDFICKFGSDAIQEYIDF